MKRALMAVVALGLGVAACSKEPVANNSAAEEAVNVADENLSENIALPEENLAAPVEGNVSNSL